MNYKFKATLQIIGINPYVSLPDKVLESLFRDAGKSKGYIPVHGTINGVRYTQTLLKYLGEWRLYINTSMLPASPKRVGETIEVTIEFDPADRTLAPHPDLERALTENAAARKVFDDLAPSMRKEIIRYIASLKTDVSRKRNIQRALGFLLGKNGFIGRDVL